MDGWMEKTVSILLINIDSLKQFFSEIKVIIAITMFAGRQIATHGAPEY